MEAEFHNSLKVLRVRIWERHEDCIGEGKTGGREMGWETVKESKRDALRTEQRQHQLRWEKKCIWEGNERGRIERI